MKRLQYNYVAADRILTPFNFEYEQVSLSNDLPISLANLFSLKSVFYLQKNPGIFSVSLRPDAPYGPDTNVLIDFLFTDFNKALTEVKNFFRLKAIEIISPDDRFKNGTAKWSKNINKRHEEGILLNIFEFYQLYTATIKGQKVDSVLISIFIDVNTVFCLHVPVGIPIKNLLLLLQSEYYIELNSESKPFHPILRREIDPEKETTGNSTSLIMFTHSGYRVAPDGNFLLRFPYFKKKVRVRKGDIIKQQLLPCCNCLACSAYCPSDLFPSFLYHNSINGRKDETLEFNINGCIRCGVCNFVCPANLPLCETITQTIMELQEE